MSLIIHTIVPEGIIVSADTRTTCKDGKGNVRYDDTAEKIIPFPNNVVVSHCGDSQITNDLSVIQFLYDLRKAKGEIATINDLPLTLLNEYKNKGGVNSTIFKISGYMDFGISACTYTVNTEDSTIKLSTGYNNYGASYNGITPIAHSIMNSGIDYDNLSLKEAISLTQLCVQANIEIYKYHAAQSIGGKCQTYVIDRLHRKWGWYQPDGTLMMDEDAPPDALEKYRREQQEKQYKNYLKERKRRKANENHRNENQGL